MVRGGLAARRYGWLIMIGPASQEPGAPFALEGRFEGLEPFRQKVRDLFALAARDGCEELILCDPDFEAWPLGERQVVEALQAWARAGRRMMVLASRYDLLMRRDARFVRWRQMWDHLLVCRKASVAGSAELPSLLWSPSWALQRLDLQRCTCVCTADAQKRALLSELLRERLKHSIPGFPASTLGL